MSEIEQARGAEHPGETEQLRDEISDTREELGETVEALARKGVCNLT